MALGAAAAAVWAAARPAWPLLEGVTARAVAATAPILGLQAYNSGSHVVFWSSNADVSFRIDITDGCTGLSLLLIYGVAVLAYPATRRQWSFALAWGVPLLVGLNTVRLATLGWIGVRAPSYFEPMHEIVWQGVGILTVCLVWFGWLHFSVLRIAPTGVLPRRAAMRARLARSVQQSSAIRMALVFFASFAVLAAVGAFAGGAVVYGRLLGLLNYFVSTGVLHIPSPLPRMSDAQIASAYALDYAVFVGGLAMLAAAPAIPWRARVRGMAVLYVPTILGVQVLGHSVGDAIAYAGHVHSHLVATATPTVAVSFVSTMVMATTVAVPLAVWRYLIRRDVEQQERADRRRGARRRRRRNR